MPITAKQTATVKNGRPMVSAISLSIVSPEQITARSIDNPLSLRRSLKGLFANLSRHLALERDACADETQLKRILVNR